MLDFCRLPARNLRDRLKNTDPTRLTLIILGVLAISLFSSLLFSARATAPLMDDTYDFLLRTKARLAPFTDDPQNSPVVIVALDDYTLSYGPLSVPEFFRHHYYVEIIKALHQAGAKSVALTRILPRFHDALSSPDEVREWFVTLGTLEGMPVLSGLSWRPQHLVLPASDYLLSMDSRNFGFLNLKRDDEVQVRRLPIRWPECQGNLGCLSLAFLAARTLDPKLEEPGNEIYIDFDPRPDFVPIVSFLEVHRRTAAFEANRDFFRQFEGKLVLIGDLNFLNRASWPTPFSKISDHGDTTVEITAQAVLTLLNHRFFRVLGPVGEILYLFGMVFLALVPLMLSRRCGPYPGLWLPAALLPGYLVLAGAAFLKHLYLPVLPGAAALLMAQIFGLSLRAVEGRQATRTSLAALSLYVSPKLAEQILEHPEFLSRGGRRQEMTVFFSDLVGFTTLAEHLSPENLVSVLNSYFESMEPVISASGGVLDKFGGDAIMAFWGAPLLPRPDHAAAACRAALDQQEALSALNVRLRAEGRPPLSTLMGLATGPMVVGNIGAKTRLNYTVMGDAVNLASRLVSVNKVYQTGIIISDQTARDAAGAVELRTLDRITVPGRRESLVIFEVMARKGALSDDQRRGRDLFEAALTLYFNRDFHKALGLFEEALSFLQGDGPSELMCARCRDFLRVPPRDDWQGVSCVFAK